MGEVKKTENHVASASAFVEGGIQDACDDACSICLEAFSDSDPSTATTCRHEFHLQCILEWCQRSSNCPMCWQSISLKDPSSQELLVAVEQERRLRSLPSRNATIFRHPVLGDIELQHLPVGMNDSELEEQIMQHLAAAAAMRRYHHSARREGSSGRSYPHARPQFGYASNSEVESTSTTETNQSPQLMPTTNDNSYSSETSSHNGDGAGPSDSQSFTDIWRSRLSSVSMKYRESISRSTREWREKLFSRSSSMADIGSEVRREINAGIATVSRMMERLETRDDGRENSAVDSSVTDHSSHDNRAHHETPSTSSG